jgi:beta-phosphoglucomutase-like phosphatase (HAD superfamily)
LLDFDHPQISLGKVIGKTKLGIQANQAIAFEDSPNGVQAAKLAGIFCVAIPNPLTQQCPFDQADLRLISLTDLSLEELLRSFSSES